MGIVSMFGGEYGDLIIPLIWGIPSVSFNNRKLTEGIYFSKAISS